MRVVSILSAQQGATLLTTHKSHSKLDYCLICCASDCAPGVNTPAWFEACRKFLSESATNIADLAALINRNHANQNPQACVSLQYSAFSYRITLGLLWEKLSRDVLHADLYRQCEARFYEVVEILNAMSKEDRAFLNQFIDVSCFTQIFIILFSLLFRCVGQGHLLCLEGMLMIKPWPNPVARISVTNPYFRTPAH